MATLRSLKTSIRFTEDEVIVILQYTTDDGLQSIAQIAKRTEPARFQEVVGDTITGCIFQLLEKLKDRPDAINYASVPSAGMAGESPR
jgi:hypothetical protein